MKKLRIFIGFFDSPISRPLPLYFLLNTFTHIIFFQLTSVKLSLLILIIIFLLNVQYLDLIQEKYRLSAAKCTVRDCLHAEKTG